MKYEHEQVASFLLNNKSNEYVLLGPCANPISIIINEFGSSLNSLEKWLLSHNAMNYHISCNILTMKHINGQVYWGNTWDENFDSYFYMKDSLLLCMISAWREIVKAKPGKIDVIFDGESINFVAISDIASPIAHLKYSDGSYELVDSYHTILERFICKLTDKNIFEIKDMIIKGGKLFYPMQELIIIHEGQFIIITYAVEKFKAFRVALLRENMIEMLNQWRDIIYDNLKDVLIYYNGDIISFNKRIDYSEDQNRVVLYY